MMAPTAVFDPDGPVLALGSAGGSRLRSALVQTMASILDEGLEPQAAVDRPRLHPAGPVVHMEPGFEEEALTALEEAGFKVRRWEARHHYFGGVSLCARRGGCRRSATEWSGSLAAGLSGIQPRYPHSGQPGLARIVRSVSGFS